MRRRLQDLLPPEKIRGFASAHAQYYPSATVWPHGEFSIGYGKRRPDGGDWHEDPFVGLGVDDVEMAERAARSAVPFDLSDVPNSHKKKPRGLKGITGFGQQMIKAGGFLIQKHYPKHRLTFGTVTLPPLSPEARAEVAEKWPELTRQLLQYLSRRLEGLGLPKLVCSVTEVQPKRLAATGAAYLHWHLLWLNHPGQGGNWTVEPRELAAWLCELLQRHIPSYRPGYINVDTKLVDGEAARYMAKYMSKGKQAVDEAVKDWGENCCPHTWWNMTADLRALVKANTARGEVVGYLVQDIMTAAFQGELDDWFAFLRHIEIDIDGVSVTVGWRGRFQPGVLWDDWYATISVDIN